MIHKIRIRQRYGNTMVPMYDIRYRGELLHRVQGPDEAINWAIRSAVDHAAKIATLERVRKAD